MSSNKKRILCAMSGGVDSSVSALLLKQKGYEVIGIFMNFWSENNNNTCPNKCCSTESGRSARSVASKLNIKLYSLNYKEIFKKKVVDDYIQGYENAKTPNPCVICNREIKFGKLLKIAKDIGASAVATGHYARIITKNKRFELHRGIDKNKDQSYFLWRIPLSSLGKILFPIGNLTKSTVRNIAKNNNLDTYNKKDSQGLCFVGESNSSFISKYVKSRLKPGNVVDIKGNIIGHHNGLAYYTIGQRTGFSVINDKWRRKGIDVPPLYVVRIDSEKNALVVGEDKYTYRQTLTIADTNWFDYPFTASINKKTLLAQIRYQHKPTKCTISKINDNEVNVKFNQAQRAITAGQSCVFYEKDKVLGGGFIK